MICLFFLFQYIGVLSATLGLVCAVMNVAILRDALIVVITPVGHAAVMFKLPSLDCYFRTACSNF